MPLCLRLPLCSTCTRIEHQQPHDTVQEEKGKAIFIERTNTQSNRTTLIWFNSRASGLWRVECHLSAECDLSCLHQLKDGFQTTFQQRPVFGITIVILQHLTRSPQPSVNIAQVVFV